MVKVFRGPFKTFMLGNDSKIERGEIGLKKSLIAIALLTFGFGLLISSASYATAPKAGDIPDFRVPAPAGGASLLDLDDFALDNDDYSWIADTDLTWTVTDNGTVPASSLTAANVLSLASGATAGSNGTYDFDVTDASLQTSSHTSDFVASSVLGFYPALSQDQLLTPSATAPGFSYVLDVVGATGATVLSLSDTVVASGAGTDWQTVYVSSLLDASGNRQTLASGAGTASLTGLTAAITSGGLFTLTATAGSLSDPVIVGFKGINNADPNDWTGVSALVSNALLSADNYATVKEVDPGYDIDDGFETASGNIARVGFSGAPHNRTFNRLNGAAKNTWVLNVKQSANLSVPAATYYPSATVVDDTSLPAALQGSDNSFVGDHSGKCLAVSLTGIGTGTQKVGYLVLNSPVPIQAGFAYAVEASVGSSAATGADAPQIHLAVHTAGFTEISVAMLGKVATSAPVASAPLAADGWVRERAYIEPSAAGAADGTTLDGLQVTILAENFSTNAVTVYLDNVRVYRTAMPDDLAWGSAKIAIAGRPDVSVGSRIREFIDPDAGTALDGQAFYGNFENASGAIGPNSATTLGNANGFFHSGALPAGMTATVNSSAIATRIEAGDANWLEVQFTAAGGQIVRTRQLTPSNVSGPLFAPGLYVLSADYQTPASQAVNPSLTMGITDNGFQTFAYVTNLQGTNGAIRRIRIPAALRDVDKLAYIFGYSATGASISHLDNVQCDLVSDLVEYNDTSLFQVNP
jgi:hypothetical protein